MESGFTCSFRKREAYDQMPQLHSHDGLCELYFLSSGERRYFILDSVMTVHAKGFVFIKAGVLHRTGYLGGGQHSRYYANVPSSWIEDLLPYLPKYYVCQKEEGLELLFSQLLQEAEGNGPFSAARCRSLVYEIVIRSWRSYQSSLVQDDGFLDAVTSFVRDNIALDLSLDAAAAFMGYSPSYFSTLFHRRSGMRYADFVRSSRITLACEALRGGSSVAQASALAGFHDPGYFKDVFRAVMKISPSAYRKENRLA